MKLKRLLITLPIALIVLAVLCLIIANKIFDFDLGISFTEKRKSSVSISLLKEVRDVFTFNTVEYIYKTVFPFDFVDTGTNWQELVTKRAHEEALSGDEVNALEVYDLCTDIGIDLGPDNTDFVVITSVVKGGFDLKGTGYENPEQAEDISRYVRVDPEGNILYLRLPESVIVDLIIDDSTSENYAYPDLGLDPEEWRILTDYISEKVEAMVIEGGILDLAREKGEHFIERLLLDAGYADIIFMQSREEL